MWGVSKGACAVGVGARAALLVFCVEIKRCLTHTCVGLRDLLHQFRLHVRPTLCFCTAALAPVLHCRTFAHFHVYWHHSTPLLDPSPTCTAFHATN